MSEYTLRDVVGELAEHTKIMRDLVQSLEIIGAALEHLAYPVQTIEDKQGVDNHDR